MRGRLRGLGIAVALSAALTLPGSAAAVCGDAVRDAGEACDDGNLVDGDCCSSACAPAEDGTTCDDGRTCTADDECLAGTCLGIPSDALCPLELERLVCWTARGKGFARRKGEAVPDEFRADGAALDVRSAASLCGAAVPDDAGRTSAPGTRLQFVAHGARATRTKPRQKPLNLGLTVRHALGDVQLTVKKPTQLLVPAAVGDGAAPPGPSSRRLACYAAKAPKRRKGSTPPPGAFVPGTTIALSDLRGGPLDYVLGQPTTLCTAERSGDAGPTGRPGYLVCHRAKTKSRVGSASLAAVSALGAGTLKAKRPRTVCLPAMVPPDDPTATQPSFPFLAGTGAVNEAMQTLWKGGFAAPRTSAAASKHDADMDAAKAVIAANLPAVQSELLKALETLTTDDFGGHASLGSLLDAAGDGKAIHAHIELVLMSPPHGPELHPHVTPPDELTRLLFVDTLAKEANEGSASALDALFRAAGSPDSSTVQHTIRSLYRTGRSRRLLQRELRKNVKPENRYLLYLE